MGDVYDIGALIPGDFPVATEDDLAAYERERECDRRRERLDASGVSECLTSDALALVVADRLRPTRAVEAARRWLAYQASVRKAGSRPVLALFGGIGCGKTVAAASVLAAEGGRYVQAEDLCRLHAARFGSEAAEFRRLMRLGVLVVDELGTEESAERAAATLHEVVDRRQSKRTLLLGNLTKASFAERLDARTVDRLRVGGVVIDVSGGSLRGSR